jgi:hypothetical protein
MYAKQQRRSVKTITIQQPYAQLILDGRKKTEFRSWRCHHRGPLAIHAGFGIDKEECRRAGYDPAKLPRGAVLCIAEMYDCSKLRGGDFGWKLRNIRKIRPVPARGLLGLWNWNRR